MKKISLKKVGLVMKNNYIINRSIPLILFIVTLVIMSLVGSMPISDIENRYDSIYRYNFIDGYEMYVNDMTREYGNLKGIDGVFSAILIGAAFLLPILTALALSSYMRDKSGNDFYHSLSVNRSEIFLANYITALINTAVTLIASQLAGVILMVSISKYDPMSLGELILAQLPVVGTVLLFSAVFTAIAMIAVTVSGTVFAGIINYAFINFYIPGTILVMGVAGNVLFNSDLWECLEHNARPFAYTSPLMRYIYNAAGAYEITALTYVTLAFSALVLIAAGIIIYSRKKNENSSKPLPFKHSVRPLQYMLTFDAILLGTCFFEAISGSMMWALIGMLLTLFFAFIAFNAFANKSFNGVFKGSKHMAFMLIITVLVSIVFVADIFHIYKEPEPDLGRIVDSYINVSANYSDREEWRGYDFNDKADETEYEHDFPLDNESVKLIGELYALLKRIETNGNYSGQSHINVSMSIMCKGDMSNYHAYATVPDSSPQYKRVKEIIDILEETFPTENRNTYYYEETAVN